MLFHLIKFDLDLFQAAPVLTHFLFRLIFLFWFCSPSAFRCGSRTGGPSGRSAARRPSKIPAASAAAAEEEATRVRRPPRARRAASTPRPAPRCKTRRPPRRRQRRRPRTPTRLKARRLRQRSSPRRRPCSARTAASTVTLSSVRDEVEGPSSTSAL